MTVQSRHNADQALDRHPVNQPVANSSAAVP